MNVIKRDGREVNFDKSKIVTAIHKASEETRVNGKKPVPDDEIESIASQLYNKFKLENTAIDVENIQDCIEDMLMQNGYFDTAKEYIRYRYKRQLYRNGNTTDGKILSLVDGANEVVIQENSNKNPSINSTQRDYIAGEVSRDICNRMLLPKDIVEAHEQGIIHFHDSDYFIQHMFNCFSGKTKFVTKDGVIQFSKCRDGERVFVLDKDGNWRDATVHKYEKQKLYDVTFRSARSEKTVTCTRDHRWILKDGTVTTNLSVGDTLFRLKNISDFRYPETDRESKMFAFGFVLGDGNDINGGVNVRLCGRKVNYKDIFIRAGFSVRYEYDNGDVVMYANNGLSKQKFLDSYCWKYLNYEDKDMLFRGLYAADGSADRSQISTSDIRILEFIKEISAISGYHISSIRTIVHDTNYKKDACLYVVSFRTHQTLNNLWKVIDIKPHRVGNLLQDTWCVEEPITHSFTLEGGIVTGNCCLVNLDDMLQNGTVINGTLVEKPHSFATACNIATQIMAQVASNQYGGQSESMAALVPFIDISRKKIRAEVESEFIGLDVSEDRKIEVTEKRLRDEIKRGVQTIQYQINTLMTTNGQAPFVSIFLYMNEVEDERQKKDFAILIEEILNQRIEGTKNEQGVWITPAFPKILYVLEEDNIKPGSKYYYLTELAAKCTAKRMVPDYISEKIMLEYKGDCYPCIDKTCA